MIDGMVAEDNEAIELDVSEDDVLFGTEDYAVLTMKTLDSRFPNADVTVWLYAVVNKGTGVQEQHTNNLPGAINWAIQLQEALDNLLAEYGDPDGVPEQGELPLNEPDEPAVH